MKKISVVVPCYNAEKYVKTLIKSVLDNSYTNFELILVNDGSSDNTLSILKDFEKQDKRIIVIDKVKNAGVSEARNTGIEKASGKYICFVDADDRLDSEYLTELVSLFDEDIVMTACSYSFEKRNDKEFIRKKKYNTFTYNIEQAKNSVLSDKSYFSYPFNKMFLTEYTKNIKFKSQEKLGEDVFFLIDYLNNVENKKVKYKDIKLYHYFITKGSASGLNCTEKKYNEQIRFFSSLEDMKNDAKNNSKEFFDRVSSLQFLNALQFIYYAYSLKNKPELKKMKLYAKEHKKYFDKKKKIYKASFRRYANVIYHAINLLLH